MGPTSQEDGSSSATSSPLQFFSMTPFSPNLGSPYPWLRELKSEERGLYLIHLLLTCANYVSLNNLESANLCLEQISQLASANGDTMQRISAYFNEALADRILKSWPGIHMALNSTKISSFSEEVIVKRHFFELCPFLKAAYLITNQAVTDAMEGEKMVHIIDLNSSEPAQWIALLHTLSSRQEGPPHLRITGIHQRREVLEQMACRLNEEAEKLDVPFQFNPIVSKLEDLDLEKIRAKTGEALAISSVFQLHSLLAFDEDIMQKQSPLQMSQKTLGELLEKDLKSSTKIDRFLSALWSLSPKLMVVAEQDSNHNGSTLMERLTEALYYYAALFDCLESSVPRTSMERITVEKMLFGEEIKNIIACEGVERKARHEKLEKWVRRLNKAGFGNVKFSYLALLQAKRLLENFGCDGYRIKEENGCVVICWQDRPLFQLSAWRFRR